MACVASLHSFGSFAAIIGSIIAKLKDESSPVHMTVEEETWFGKQNHIFIQQLAVKLEQFVCINFILHHLSSS